MSSHKDASFYIEKLSLMRHPEGGWYRETYRSAENENPRWLQHGTRHASSAIYFLLQLPDFSAFHRIKSDEMWHIYDASQDTGLRIWVLEPGASDARIIELGREGRLSGHFQDWVPARAWFAAELFSISDNPLPSGSWLLSGCTVSPGFDFADFELASLDQLKAEFPYNKDIIQRLCILP